MTSSAVLDQLLRPALERAVVVARTAPKAPETPEVPAGLRPFLRFAKLPPLALAAVRATLDGEPSFRERVAAESTEEALGQAGWLFVSRPDGWEDELAGLVADAESALVDADERAARREAAHLQSIVAGLEVRLKQSEDHAARLDQEVRREQQRADGAVSASERLRADLDQARAERTDAVRRLKETEARLAQRSAELRTAQTDGAEPAATTDLPDHSARVAAIEERARRAAALADDMASHVVQLSAVVETLQRELSEMRGPTGAEPLTGDASADDAVRGRSNDHSAPARAARRRPAPLQRGVLDDSPEAVEQLFALAGAVVLVDGYNVAILAWPHLTPSEQRRSLEQAATAWHARYGADFVLVFDGDDVGGRVARSTGSQVRVLFTRAEVEADDEILSLIAEVAPEHPCIVVSDDRRVREGAWQRGANVAGSAQILTLLRR